jgi:hypothetical protein
MRAPLGKRESVAKDEVSRFQSFRVSRKNKSAGAKPCNFETLKLCHLETLLSSGNFFSASASNYLAELWRRCRMRETLPATSLQRHPDSIN